MSHGADSWEIAGQTWEVGDSHPLHLGILFVDLVGSTELASILPLDEYAAFSRSFRETCLRQCRYFFEEHWADKYAHDGSSYSIEASGDELAVFVYTDRPHDDVYQLVCLGIALKCAWLGVPLNAERLASGRPTFDLAVGVHSGPVWATRRATGFERSGFAINLAKRVESASRSGERFRIFVTDPAFKLVNRRVRNLLFGPRTLPDMKGVTPLVGVYELVESFVDAKRRMHPELAKRFLDVAERALSTNSFDLWIHSCAQVMWCAETDSPAEACVELCKRVLNIDPWNPVALFYQAEADRSRGDPESAELYLEDLTLHWPTLGDGWLALGRVQKQLGRPEAARRALLQARRHGVSAEEEPLPDSRGGSQSVR